MFLPTDFPYGARRATFSVLRSFRSLQNVDTLRIERARHVAKLIPFVVIIFDILSFVCYNTPGAPKFGFLPTVLAPDNSILDSYMRTSLTHKLFAIRVFDALRSYWIIMAFAVVAPHHEVPLISLIGRYSAVTYLVHEPLLPFLATVSEYASGIFVFMGHEPWLVRCPGQFTS